MNMDREISLTVNGERVTARVEARKSLVDFLREDLGLTGSHVGCEHGVCGACTVRVGGEIVRGCSNAPPLSSTCGTVRSARSSRTSSVAVAFSAVLNVSLSVFRANSCEGSRPTLATSHRTRLRQRVP